MLIRRVLASVAPIALGAALAAGAAHAQSPAAATAKTEAQAQSATGKATTDAPAKTAVQGTAAAVREGVAPQAAAAPSAQAAAKPAQAVVASGDLIDTLKTSGQFKTLLSALDATNLTAVLRNNRNLTLFAPTDTAFAALPAGELDKLMGDKAALQKVLTHHLVNAPIDSTQIKGVRRPMPSVAADHIILDGGVETALKADNATIVQADVKATNGNIHVVDQVLKPLPPEAAPAPAPAG